MRALVRFLVAVSSVPLACTDFEPRSSSVAPDAPSQGRGSTVSGSTTVIQPTQRDTLPDTFAVGRQHVFAVNDDANSISILSPALAPARPGPSRNVAVRDGARALKASTERDFAVVLSPEQRALTLMCPDGALSELELEQAADDAVIHTSNQGTWVFAYDAKGSAGSTRVSVVTVNGCTASPSSVASLEVGPSPHQLVLGTSAVYVRALDGVSRVDLEASRPRVAPLLNGPISELKLARTSDGDFLVAHAGQELKVINGLTGDESVLSANAEPGAGGAGGQGGEASAAAGESSGGGATLFVDPRFAVGNDGKVLVAADGQLLRYELPTNGTPDEALPLAASSLVLGEQDDCGVAFTPGEDTLWKVSISPLDATRIDLTRDIRSVELFCRPPREGAPASCCAGIAVVAHVLEPLSPLGQTEAYSVVDLANLSTEVRVSSLPVMGIAAFDGGNGALVALGDATSTSRQLRIFTPFEPAGLSNQRQLDLTDRPSVVGSVLGPPALGAIGYVGLVRRDGGALFISRPAQSMISPSAYQVSRQLDFRLTERVTPGKFQPEAVP